MRLLSFLLIALISTSYSQTLIVEIKNSTGQTAILYSLSGEKTQFVDSLKNKLPGQFALTDTKKLQAGFYRVVADKNKNVDFVYDNEDVNLLTDAGSILDSMQVISSESNKLYYRFLKLNKNFKIKSELLNLILARYPKDNDYYLTTKQTLTNLQDEYREFVNIASQKNPKSFIARYIKSAQLPVIELSVPLNKQLDFLKMHALDNVDFNDTELINSDAFANKSIEYLMYYRNPQLPKDLLEKEFMVAVDTILGKARVHPLVYRHITEYLVDGFRKFGFDKIIDYILDNYVIKDDVCLDSELELSIERRIMQARLFKIGNEVPHFVLPDAQSKMFELNKTKAEKTLIIFYSSNCPHCSELLPEIKKHYEKQNQKVKVVAVSLDTDKNEWLNFIKANKLESWTNLCDLKGWISPVVETYSIFATPTMFLLDKDLKIIGKDYK